MNKNTKFFVYLVRQIVVLMLIGMFMTFFTDFLQSSGFFGDTLYVKDPAKAWDNGDGIFDTKHIWGARHYWYFWLMTSLFIITIIKIIVWITEYPWDK